MLCCVEFYRVVLCYVALCSVEVCDVVCVFLLSLFAQAVCYSKRGPNIKEFWEKNTEQLPPVDS